MSLPNVNPNISSLRKDYTLQVLDFNQTANDPITQFKTWFSEALEAQVNEPNAMHLATVSAAGRPSGRIVLLKGIEADSFVFFTNYESRKSQEMLLHAWVALTFFWPELERQVRIEGKVEKTSREASDQYFQSRPRGSQIGAWASPQSQIIPDRQVLEQAQEAINQQYGEHAPIPRPLHWGGFQVTPEQIEFWQGRSSRLHDRILYVKTATGIWQKQRLAP
jgi:pyridoxamine 5'-phosphate oxidase